MKMLPVQSAAATRDIWCPCYVKNDDAMCILLKGEELDGNQASTFFSSISTVPCDIV